MPGFDISSVSFAAAPLFVLLSPLLSGFARWLSGFLGNWLLMGIFVLIAEILPRFLGLGQGLISYVLGVLASASFSAFQSALSLGGIELPSFSELLQGLPPGVVWACSAMRVHKVVFILVSIPIVKLFREVMKGVASSATKMSASALLRGGR